MRIEAGSSPRYEDLSADMDLAATCPLGRVRSEAALEPPATAPAARTSLAAPPSPAPKEPASSSFWSFFGRVADVFGSIVEGAVDTVFGIGRAIAGVFTSPATFPRELVENIGGVALLVAGRTASAVQTLVGLEAVGRRLTEEELAPLRRIFGDSVDFSRVRIKEGTAGLYNASERPFVLGNTIYTKGHKLSPSELAHELVHVWQYQNGGPDYMPEALLAEPLGDGYEWEEGVAQGKSWRELNPEQQAELILDAVRSGYFSSSEPEETRRFIVLGVDYTAFLRDGLAELRARRGAP